MLLPIFILSVILQFTNPVGTDATAEFDPSTMDMPIHKAYIHYMVLDEDNTEVWKTEEVKRFETSELKPEAPDAFALRVFEQLFAKQGAYCMPSDVKVLGVSLWKKRLILNVSKDICSYGGGSAYEYALVSQIMKTALALEFVDSFELVIENGTLSLPEGTILQ